MAYNFVRNMIFLTFVGVLLFIWTPTVECIEGGHAGGRRFGGFDPIQSSLFQHPKDFKVPRHPSKRFPGNTHKKFQRIFQRS